MPTVAKASCPDIGLWIFPVIQWMARFRQSPHRRLQCRSHRVLSHTFNSRSCCKRGPGWLVGLLQGMSFRPAVANASCPDVVPWSFPVT